MRSPVLRAFIAGSAFPAVFFPFALLSLSSLARPGSGFHMEYVVWFFPFAMGSWNVLFIQFRHHLPGSVESQYWLAGVLLGIVFPTIGNLTGVPGKLWGLQFPQGLWVIPLAMLAYALVWRFPVRFMNDLLQLNEINDV